MRRMNEEFAVAVAAGDGAVEPAAHLQAELCAAIAYALFHYGVQRRIGDDAALADLPRLQLELRLDEHQQIAAVLEQRNECRQDQRERDERQVADDKIEIAADLF